MGWLKNLQQYRDERDRLIQLRYAVDRESEAFRKAIALLKQNSDEYQECVSNHFFELDILYADIAKIETQRMQRRASFWRIPLPHRPTRDQEPDDFWDWHAPHYRYYISDKGLSQLRREVYQEWEMWSKPWLSWMAIVISVVSLAISVLKP